MKPGRLRRELLRERFGPIPWAERYRRPTPLPTPEVVPREAGEVVRVIERAAVTKARRRVLVGLDERRAA